MNRGCLNLVSVGPGIKEQITGAALRAIAESDVIVAYDLYLSWIRSDISEKTIITTPLSQEKERVQKAIDAARNGSRVALISSGDIGIYAMATLAFELMSETDTFAVEVFPGVTAAVAGAALLGAPLSHDFATLSLSDLMCPWQWIEERARHIAQLISVSLSTMFRVVNARRASIALSKFWPATRPQGHSAALCATLIEKIRVLRLLP
jgi:precorrin-3B C17-methyltransferase